MNSHSIDVRHAWSLPDEISNIVFSFCDRQDLAHFQSTCRTWKTKISSVAFESLWKDLFHRHPTHTNLRLAHVRWEAHYKYPWSMMGKLEKAREHPIRRGTACRRITPFTALGVHLMALLYECSSYNKCAIVNGMKSDEDCVEVDAQKIAMLGLVIATPVLAYQNALASSIRNNIVLNWRAARIFNLLGSSSALVIGCISHQTGITPISSKLLITSGAYSLINGLFPEKGVKRAFGWLIGEVHALFIRTKYLFAEMRTCRRIRVE